MIEKKFELENTHEAVFKFDLDNLKKDFEIENMHIQDEDIGLLQKYSKNEITLDEVIGQIKNDAMKGIL